MYSSIYFYLLDDSICKEYRGIFVNRYEETVLKTLEFKFDGGWIYSSKKYHLILGENLYTKEGLFNITSASGVRRELYDKLKSKSPN
jgi:hypothetical protein